MIADLAEYNEDAVLGFKVTFNRATQLTASTLCPVLR